MSHRPEPARLPALIPGEARRAGRTKAGKAGVETADFAAAHMLGQSGQRRGLRGGPPVLQAARSAYLRAEWSGPADRRPLPGATVRAAI